MLIYKGKELTKFKNKISGKNKNELDGFYRSTDGEEFFVKKPQDPKELFAELFAGFLIEEFKERELIPEIYHKSFICSDVIQFEDGSFGLIQPKVKFKELHQVISTGNRNGADRNPLWEMILGPNYYLSLTKLENYFGLSMVLMMSILLGDHSIHSGNVVCLEPQDGKTQFSRIDLGAAFRNFAYPENNEDLFYPMEYKGWFNPAVYTKGYLLNYKKITGLFPAIARKAKLMLELVNDAMLKQIVATVLTKIPTNLINAATQKELSEYIGIASFNDLSLGNNLLNHDQFCSDFVKVLQIRLAKLATLRELPANMHKKILYRSTKKQIQNDSPVSIYTDLAFPDQMDIWQLALTYRQENFFDKINLADLVTQFHFFKDILIKQAELFDQSDSYTECELLERLFTLMLLVG